MPSNTEPIPVAHALRLCEMALTQTEGFDAQTGCCANCDLSRAVMRPLLAGIREPLARLNPTWFCGHTSDMYPILAALRDYFDKTRPDWRSR